MGAHPNAMSSVVTDRGEVSLEDFIAQNSEAALGADVMSIYGSALPFLFKALSIARPLSIQLHPDKATAALLHDRDPKHYPDANHKPEIAIAYSAVEALFGFRAWAEITAMLQRYPEIAGLLTEEHEGIEGLYVELQRKNSKQYTEAMKSLEQRLRDAGSPDKREKYFLDSCVLHGCDDKGLVCFFLMNLLELAPGEAIFVDACIPHAYLSGDLIECMANSDNVVRAGLTEKFQDMDTLLSLIDYDESKASVYYGDPVSANPEVRRYRPPVREFCVERISAAETASYALELKGPEILLCVEGQGEVSGTEGSCGLQKGSVVFLPAAMRQAELRVQGLMFRAGVSLP